jgi:hypothetical protein
LAIEFLWGANQVPPGDIRDGLHILIRHWFDGFSVINVV